MSIKQYPIFLASSYELQPEREKFEILIGRQNKRLIKKNVQFRLEIWEDMGAELNDGRKQDDYNKILNEAEIVVVLFWTKMGKYTREEFDLAYKRFNETRKPIIYAYEKTSAPTKAPLDWEKQSKADFLKMLLTQGKEQFHSTFQHDGELLFHFQKTLYDLFDKGTFQIGEPIKFFSRNSPHSPSFVIGREKELEQISDKLSKKGSIVLICGEGGMGKTTLAAKYWHENKYTYGHGVYLFCERGILNSMIDDGLGLELLGIDEDEKIRQIQRKLNSLGDDVLLLLDNANDVEDIQKFIQVFSGFNGNILITSRCREVMSNPENELLLRHLTPSDAKELFVKHYREEGPDFDILLERFLNAIDYHTLLIEIFSKNLSRASARGVDLKAFLQRFEDKGIQLERIANMRVETDYAFFINSKAASPNDILEVLYDFSNLSEAERYCLVNLALLPVNDYRQQFLMEIFEPEDKAGFYETLDSLYQKGWVGGEYAALRLSPVVQKLVIHRNQETLWEDGKAWVKKLTDLIKYEKDKDNAHTKFNWIPFGRHVAKSYDNIPHADFIKFLDNLRMILLLKGGTSNLLESKSYVEKVLDSVFIQSGVDVPVATYWLSSLALILEELGGVENLVASKGYFQQCLDLKISFLDENDTRIAADRSHLALVLLKIGGKQNLLDAKILLELALESDILNFGELSGDTATTRSNLAMILKELGGESDILEAKIHLEKAIITNLELFEEISPSAARDLLNYATVLQHIGGKENLLEAKRFLELALSSDMANFPENSPHLVSTYINLGVVLNDLGEEADLIDAKVYFEKAMDLAISCFGEDSTQVNESRTGLADVLRSIGGTKNVLDAKKLLQDALISTERKFGKDKLQTAPILFQLGALNAEFEGIQGKIEEKNLIERSLAIYRMNNFDDDYFKIVEILKWLEWVNKKLYKID